MKNILIMKCTKLNMKQNLNIIKIIINKCLIKKKLNMQRGFSLAETLVVVLIILLVSSVIAAGMPAAQKAYNNVLVTADAQVYMSTALTESAPSRSFCVFDFPITVTLSSVTVSRRLRCPCATASDAVPRAVASIKRARILLFIIITAIAPLQAVNGFSIIGIAIYAHPVLFPKQVGQKTQPGQVS